MGAKPNISRGCLSITCRTWLQMSLLSTVTLGLVMGTISDALDGTVKLAAKREVKARNATIRNAADLPNFCQTKLQADCGLCCNKRRCFFLVQEEDVAATKVSSDLKTVKGRRAIHSIRSTVHGNLEARKLTYFCEPCLDLKSDECRSLSHAGKWIRHAACTTMQSQGK